MDLYEIRKKAKERKEADEKAAGEAAGVAGAEDVSSAGPDQPPKPSPKKPRKKAASKPRKSGLKEKAAPEEPSETAVPVDGSTAHAGEPQVVEGPAQKTGDELMGEGVADEFDGDGEIFLDEPDIPLDELIQQAFEAGKAEDAAEPALRDAAAQTDVPAKAAPAPAVAEPAAGKVAPKEPDKPVDMYGSDESEADNIIEYLAFMLAEEEYAVKVSDIKEIIRPQKITMVPRAPEFVEGIFSLRGVIIPVFDMKKRLGFQNVERERTARILIVSDGGTAQGMIVDRVTGVARLKADAIEPPPAVIGGVEAEYLEGIGRLDGRLLILFNTSRVLSMEG